MLELNANEFLYTSKAVSDQDVMAIQKIYRHSALKGQAQQFVFDDLVVLMQQALFFDDVLVPFDHDTGSTFVCGYFFDAGKSLNSNIKEESWLVNGTNEFYSGSIMTESKHKFTLFKKNHTFSNFLVIPTPKLLQEMIRDDAPYAPIIARELEANSSQVMLGRQIINPKLTALATEARKYSVMGAFGRRMIEVLAKEYFYLLIQDIAAMKQGTDRIALAKSCIKANLPQRSTLMDVAKELRISKRTLNNLFQKENTTFKEVRQMMMLEMAEELIVGGASPRDVSKYFGYRNFMDFQKVLQSK